MYVLKFQYNFAHTREDLTYCRNKYEKSIILIDKYVKDAAADWDNNFFQKCLWPFFLASLAKCRRLEFYSLPFT